MRANMTLALCALLSSAVPASAAIIEGTREVGGSTLTTLIVESGETPNGICEVISQKYPTPTDFGKCFDDVALFNAIKEPGKSFGELGLRQIVLGPDIDAGRLEGAMGDAYFATSKKETVLFVPAEAPVTETMVEELTPPQEELVAKAQEIPLALEEAQTPAEIPTEKEKSPPAITPEMFEPSPGLLNKLLWGTLSVVGFFLLIRYFPFRRNNSKSHSGSGIVLPQEERKEPEPMNMPPSANAGGVKPLVKIGAGVAPLTPSEVGERLLQPGGTPLRSQSSMYDNKDKLSKNGGNGQANYPTTQDPQFNALKDETAEAQKTYGVLDLVRSVLKVFNGGGIVKLSVTNSEGHEASRTIATGDKEIQEVGDALEKPVVDRLRRQLNLIKEVADSIAESATGGGKIEATEKPAEVSTDEPALALEGGRSNGQTNGHGNGAVHPD